MFYHGNSSQNIVEIKRAEQGNRISLFCTTVDCPLWNKSSQRVDCVVRIYVTGSIEQYTHLRYDRLLGDELWAAAVGQKMTDVEFVVGNLKFYANKFMLAARSPVFRSMFNAGNDEPVIVYNVNPAVFEEFLRFLYTGQLSQPIAGAELGRLAEKFEIEALVNLCRKVVLKGASLNCEEIVDLVSSINRSTYESFYSIQSDRWRTGLLSETFTVQVDDIKERSCKWLVDHAYLYKLEPDKQRISFLSCGQVATDVGSIVDRVEIHVQELASQETDKQKQTSIHLIMDSTYLKYSQKTLQVFSTSTSDLTASSKFLFRFVVHRSSLVANFEHQIRDSLFATQLWSAAENKQWTDIEFQVGGKIFPAHRSLLAARCPTLAARIPDEFLSDPVQINDVGPCVFEALLHFLYTGQLPKEVSSLWRIQQVLEAGETFQVKTLQELAKWTQLANPDELSETLIRLLG